MGDLDGDGVVSFSDFLTLANNFGMVKSRMEGDIDNDGVVGFSDFLVLADNFGKEIVALPDDDVDVLLVSSI